MDQFIEFGVYSGKLIVTFIFIAGLMLFIIGLIMKQKLKPDFHVEDINSKLDELQLMIQSVVLEKPALKNFIKELKERQKKRAKPTEGQRPPHLFFLKFEGDIQAHAVNEFRDEITAVLTVAQKNDEVVISIDSPGGTVHGYGLAAAQILRLKEAGLQVTACVDKVAASGGYMMACTTHKILAAPFAILGSIGVLAQVPNFHRLLKKHNVDYEEISSGEYKRTVSLLGEITEKGRAKFQEQIVDTHELFKNFVQRERSQVDVSKVATGEYWYGIRAKELHLVDDIMTSDEYLLRRHQDGARLFSIKFEPKKKISDKLKEIVGHTVDHAFSKASEKLMEPPKL